MKYISEYGNPFVKISLRRPAVPMADVLTGTIMNRDDLAMIMKGEFGDYELRIPNYDLDAIRTMLDLPIRF